MYDATIGRFFAADPIGLDGGDTNFYRYVQNNPTNAVDPAGLGPEWHHTLPQKVFGDYWKYVKSLGIDIDAKEWGWILDQKDHSKIHPLWNTEWEKWFKTRIKEKSKITLEEIIAQKNKLAKDPQFAPFLKNGVGANISYKEWGKIGDKAKYFKNLRKAFLGLLLVVGGCFAGIDDAYAAFGPILELGKEDARQQFAAALAAIQAGKLGEAEIILFGPGEACEFAEKKPKGLICQLMAPQYQSGGQNLVLRLEAELRKKWVEYINKMAQTDKDCSCP